MSNPTMERYEALLQEAKRLRSSAGVLAAQQVATSIRQQSPSARWLAFDVSGGDVDWYDIHDETGAVVAEECRVDSELMLAIVDADLTVLDDHDAQVLDLDRALSVDEADVEAGTFLGHDWTYSSMPELNRQGVARRP